MSEHAKREGRRTEARNPRARGLESFTTREILELMNDEDATVPAAVRAALPAIERAVDEIVTAFGAGHRLRYIGAGTSGRLGVLDASEAPPTFGVDEDLVRGIIAGGDAALRHSIEGAEDDSRTGAREAREHVRDGDVLVGISASGRAKFVTAAMVMAREVGARTVALTCDASSPLAKDADIAIVVDVGPEVLAGSSRLKAGTATKLVLNMLSTAAMIRSGRTRGDLMVDLRPTNVKLRERAVRMVQDETGLGEDEARARLEAAGWSVRKALER
ncbi:MAG TPA: N-acetylmuramic acid 6-phosphate etherase [Candidatus Limnocylindria bacterium]|nr:N-acetylmuramic acid 6-phosphate etherase [Candidatus Limnocylindria bacterium]